MADVDVSDIEHEDGLISVFAPHTDYAKAKQALTECIDGISFEVDEIQFLAQNLTPVVGEDSEVLEKFLFMLNDLDAVQNIYHNVEPSDA